MKYSLVAALPRNLRNLVTVSWPFLFCLLLAGCDVGYLTRGAYQEARLLWKRKPITTVLERNNLPPAVRTKLELVLRVREFARDKLGLNVGGAYSTVTPVDEGAITWIVIAAPRESLRPYNWWFPIVGYVPYRGYFKRADAEAEAASLESNGLDTFVRSAVAFSSLGYFDDPLLSNLLNLDKVELAGVIIHELFHRTFFLPSSVEFNESAANFIGVRGAVDFFDADGGANSAEVRTAEDAATSDLRFAAFLKEQEARLLKLYSSGLSAAETLKQRALLFAELKQAYRKLKPTLSGMERFDLDKTPLNNAVLLNYLMYFKDLDVFAALFRLNHRQLRPTIDEIIRLASAHPEDPFFAVWQRAQQARNPPL